MVGYRGVAEGFQTSRLPPDPPHLCGILPANLTGSLTAVTGGTSGTCVVSGGDGVRAKGILG